LYEVIEEPKVFSEERSVRVKFLKSIGGGDGNFNLQQEYEVRVIKASTGINVIEGDQRYQLKPYSVIFSDSSPTTGQAPDGVLRNGELSFDTGELELFVWNNNSWVTASKPPSQDIMVMDINAQVDSLNAKAAGLEFDINALVQDRVRSPHLYYSDDAPTGNTEGNLIDGDIWLDSNDLELKFYSQGAWINPDRTTEIPKHNHYQPATLRWKFTTDDSTTAPPTGYFKRDKNKRWRFSFKTHDGVDLGVDVIDDTDTHAWDTQMTVWYPQGPDKWKMKAHYKLSEWRWNYDKAGVGHAEFKQSSVHGRLLSNGMVYYVSVGGWW